MRGISTTAVLAVLLTSCAWTSHAQEDAQAATSSANSSVAASSIKASALLRIRPPKPKTASSEPQVDRQDSAYMIALSGPPAEDVDRKELEENAGPNAGKLFLRSLPVRADVFVNGKIVGQTPLLLVVAPGRYQIAMRGPRQELGNRTVGLLPKETVTVVITLKQLYPSTVRAF
jgi:PEGA domain